MHRAWRFVMARPQLMANVLAKTPPIIFNGGAWVTLNLVAGERLSALSVAVAIGVMQCVRAVGTGVGPLMPTSVIPRDPRVGSLVAFTGMALFVGFDALWVSILALALWGVGQGHNWVISTAEVQARTPDHLLGRVAATDLCLLSLGGALAGVLAGWVSDRLGDPAAGAWVTFGLAALLDLLLGVEQEGKVSRARNDGTTPRRRGHRFLSGAHPRFPHKVLRSRISDHSRPSQ